MKWTSFKKQEPTLGDKKEKIKFALFPVKINDVFIWFEKYIQVYEYKTYYYSHDVVVSGGIFTEKYYTDLVQAVGWKKTDKKLI